MAREQLVNAGQVPPEGNVLRVLAVPSLHVVFRTVFVSILRDFPRGSWARGGHAEIPTERPTEGFAAKTIGKRGRKKKREDVPQVIPPVRVAKIRGNFSLQKTDVRERARAEVEGRTKWHGARTGRFTACRTPRTSCGPCGGCPPRALYGASARASKRGTALRRTARSTRPSGPRLVPYRPGTAWRLLHSCCVEVLCTGRFLDFMDTPAAMVQGELPESRWVVQKNRGGICRDSNASLNLLHDRFEWCTWCKAPSF